jgi:hypothetical protein
MVLIDRTKEHLNQYHTATMIAGPVQHLIHLGKLILLVLLESR